MFLSKSHLDLGEPAELGLQEVLDCGVGRTLLMNSESCTVYKNTMNESTELIICSLLYYTSTTYLDYNLHEFFLSFVKQKTHEFSVFQFIPPPELTDYAM